MDILDCNTCGRTWLDMAALVNNFWSKYWVFFFRKVILEGDSFIPNPFVALTLLNSYSCFLMVEVIDLNEYLGQFLGLFVWEPLIL